MAGSKTRPLLLLAVMIALFLLAMMAIPLTSPASIAAQAFPTLPLATFVTPTFGPSPTFTPLPTFTLSAPRTPGACPQPVNLIPGQLVVVTGGINVRSEPSPSAPLIAYFSEERLVRLIGGPACGGGYNWWQVTGFGGEPGATSGWVIEGNNVGRLFIAPALVVPDDPCYSPLPLAVGDEVIAVTGVRVRNAASLAAYTVTVVPIDGRMTILEGPACFNGINWWRVSTTYPTTGTPVEGWAAEGFPDNYWLQSVDALTGAVEIPCVLPLTLRPGSRVAVNYYDGVPRRLRAEPNVNAQLLLEMPDEIALQIIDGPVCSGGYNWWNVRVISTGYVGWFAEGRPGRYNLEIISR